VRLSSFVFCRQSTCISKLNWQKFNSYLSEQFVWI